MSWKGSTKSGKGGDGAWGGAAWQGGSWAGPAATGSTKGWNSQAAQAQVVKPPAKQTQSASWGASNNSWGTSNDSWGSGKDQWNQSSNNKGMQASDSWSQEPDWKKAAMPEAKGKGVMKGGKKGDTKAVPALADGMAKGSPKGDGKGIVKGDAKGTAKGDAKGVAKGCMGQKGWQSPAAVSPQEAAFNAQVEKHKKELASIETMTAAALDVARKALENENTPIAGVKASIDSMERQLERISRMQDTLSTASDAARKANAKDAARELGNLLAKAKGLTQQLALMTSKLKPRYNKSQTDMEIKAKEAADAAGLKPMLAKVAKDIAAVEEATAEVSKTPGIDDPPPEGEELVKLVTTVETTAGEAQRKIDAAKADIQQKLKVIQSYAPEAKKTGTVSFGDFQKKLVDSKKTLDAILSKIQPLAAGIYVETGKELVAKAEEGFRRCQDAELPFLTGVEVLPDDENEAALKDCDEASSTASEAFATARKYLNSKVAECRKMTKPLGDTTADELSPLLTKLSAVEQRLNKFKVEMAGRKTAAIMVVATEAVSGLEEQVEKMETECKMLTSDSLDDESAESITEVAKKAKVVMNETQSSLGDVKKVFSDKQREAKAPNTDASVTKINNRLEDASKKISKIRNAISTAEKLVRVKEAITSGEGKVRELEAEVDKVQKLVPEGDHKLSLDAVASLDEGYASALRMIKTISNLLQPFMKDSTPKAKTALQKLMDQKNEAQKANDKVRADTKNAREEALSDSFIQEDEANTKAAETASNVMADAERPFLTGADLALKDRQDAIDKCTEGVATIKKALDAARRYADQKTSDTKGFGQASTTKMKGAFAETADRRKKIGAKLPSFEKELRERTATTKMVKAKEDIDALEAEVKKTVELAEPFKKEGADKMSEEEASQPLKAFMDANKETNKKIDEARSFLMARQREQKNDSGQLEVVKALQERVSKAQEEITSVKKFTAIHEQRSLSTRLLAEAKESVGTLDAEVKKATDACAALVEHGGTEFLLDTSRKTLTAAVVEHLKQKEITIDDMFQAANEGKPMDEKAFVKYLADLAEIANADTISCFSDERRLAIFKKLSTDGKIVTKENFRALLEQTYFVIADDVVITDKFTVDDSTALCKVERWKYLVLLGVPKEDDKGLLRAECRYDDKQGWVTILQKPKRNYCRPHSAYKGFQREMDTALAESSNAIRSVGSGLSVKIKQLGSSEETKEARENISKLNEEVTKAQKSLEELWKKVKTAKDEFTAKEKAEVCAHIEVKNMKEAAAYVEVPKGKVEAVEAACRAAEEAAAPMVSISGEELEAFGTPGTVSDAVHKHVSALAERANEAREAIREQTKAVANANIQTGGTKEASKQLTALSKQVEDAIRKGNRTSGTVKTKCKALVTPKMEPTSEAIRSHAMKLHLSGEALFDSLKEGEKISEEAFCKFLVSLEGVSLTPEVAKLVSQNLERDGISKDNFIKYVVLYYKVEKSVAFTDTFDVTICKSTRKAESGEVLELLEGPSKDPKNGMMRVKGKLLSDPTVVGWVTLSGNQGTIFLSRCNKP